MAENRSMAQKIINERPKNDAAGTEAYSEALPGLVSGFHFHANGIGEELATDQPIPDHRDGWLWLHFDLADPRTTKSVQSISGLPATAKALLVTENNQQQLYADDVCTYGVFADFIAGENEGEKEICFVPFAMTQTVFISSCRSRLSVLDAFRDAIRNGQKISGVGALVGLIFEHVVDSVDDYAKTLVDNLDDVEELILIDDLGDQRDVLGRIRRATIRLNRQITNALALIHRFEHENARHEKSPFRFATERLGQRLDWLNSEIAAVRERAHVLQEEAMLRTADQTNRHLQVLSIVATVFLPATLIAGIFGMNVKGLPLTENSDGFLWSMALIVVAAGLVFWLLKKSGILKR
jgi:zinc transporter